MRIVLFFSVVVLLFAEIIGFSDFFSVPSARARHCEWERKKKGGKDTVATKA